MALPAKQQPETEQPPKPNDASQLPPEALDLASKLFDLGIYSSTRLAWFSLLTSTAVAREGKTTELSQYITAGIPVNLTNSKGDTLLMLASYHGHLEAVRMLLDKGADANVLNDRGQSIVAGAVFKGEDEVVKALFEKGADVMKGQPNAVDSAKMFKRDDILTLFGEGGS
jgi:ankyrin repeat protein